MAVTRKRALDREATKRTRVTLGMMLPPVCFTVCTVFSG